MKAILSVLILVTLFSQFAFAWGERGHHLAGFMAAYGVDEWLDNNKDRELVDNAFTERAHMMGHLNNIPDISWKGVANKEVLKLNGPTHYFDPELLFEKQSFDETTKQMHSLPHTYEELKEKFQDKKNPFTGEEIKLYSYVGSAPYRIQDLFDKMKKVLECAAKKSESKSEKSRKTFFKMNGEVIQGSVFCKDSITYAQNLLAAFALGGTMGHFVADLSQPLHTTIDYDGYVKGQGGLHAYFEDDMVRDMPMSLESKVMDKLKDKGFRKEMYKKLNLEKNPKVVEIIFSLIQDSRNNYERMMKLDQKHSLVKKGDIIPFGVKPSSKNKKATRKEVSTVADNKDYIQFAVDRLATASYVLSYLWHRAWVEAGKPEIGSISKIETVYPLDVSFLKPDYTIVPKTLKKKGFGSSFFD